MLEQIRQNDQRPVHDRLYDLNRLQMQKKLQTLMAGDEKTTGAINEQTNKPLINKKSQNLVRDKPVQIMLYEDAQRRKTKQSDANIEKKHIEDKKID
jgi:hypothetical protein